MPGKENVSSRQFMILVVFFTMGSAILLVPSSLALYAKQDAWLAAIFGMGMGFFLVWLYTSVGKVSQLTLMDLNEKLLGKWLGKAVSLLFIIPIFIGTVGVLFHVGNFMTSQMMPETPIQSFYIVFTAIVVMGVRLGLETLARSAEILFPWFLFLFFVFVLFLSPQINMDYIQPVLETGIKPTFPAALFFLSIITLPLVVLLTIFPAHVNQPKDGQRSFFTGYIIGGLIMIVIITLSILVLGSDLTSRNLYPSYAMAKTINIGQFIRRVEAIIAFLWFISLYFKLALYFYATVVAVSQIFNLKNYRPLVLPLGMILVSLSVIQYPSSVYEQTSNIEFWVPFIITAGLFYPLLLLLISAFKRVR